METPRMTMSKSPAGPLSRTPRAPATIVPLFDRLAAPLPANRSSMYRDRVFTPPGSNHVFIALHAPAREQVRAFLPAARRLLGEHWDDRGAVRHDIVAALVTILDRYVPEYIAATVPTRPPPEGGPNNKNAATVPPVIFSLSDGQTIGLGFPRGHDKVGASPLDPESALVWSRRVTEKGETFLRTRHLDKECAALYDTSWETDMLKPVEDILATILAATEQSRREIFAVIAPDTRADYPRSPLRVDNPRPF